MMIEPALNREDQIIVCDDFLDVATAEQMRAGIRRHFEHPEHHGQAEQIWNYWYVPDSYTYLRTTPSRIMDPALISGFLTQLRTLVAARIGKPVRATTPYLSVYTHGMGQTWHNDAMAGLMGYVYSLTEHELDGGDTLIWKGAERSDQPLAGSGLFHQIPPRFNRLIVFDDQLPHAVSTVQGTLDPLRGRAILHGHVSLI